MRTAGDKRSAIGVPPAGVKGGKFWMDESDAREKNAWKEYCEMTDTNGD